MFLSYCPYKNGKGGQTETVMTMVIGGAYLLFVGVKHLESLFTTLVWRHSYNVALEIDYRYIRLSPIILLKVIVLILWHHLEDLAQ